MLSYQSNHKSITNLPAELSIYCTHVKMYMSIFSLLTLSPVRVFICLVVLCLQVWSLKLEQEVEKNKALTEALQTLATEHHELQQSLCKSRRSSTLRTLSEDDFYDAVSGQQPLGGQLVKYLTGVPRTVHTVSWQVIN